MRPLRRVRRMNVGARRVARRAVAKARRLAALPAAPGQAGMLRRHAEVLQRALREPLRSGNHVELLVDGPATHEAMFAAIDAARDHINLESYIVEADGPGQALAQRLIAKCREG